MLVMDCGELGTVRDLMRYLVAKRVAMSLQEHEALVAYCALQVVQGRKIPPRVAAANPAFICSDAM